MDSVCATLEHMIVARVKPLSSANLRDVKKMKNLKRKHSLRYYFIER